MSEDQPTARLTFPRPLMVVAAGAAGIVVAAIFLLLSAHVAGAAALPPPPSSASAAPTTLGGAVSSVPDVVATTASSPDPLASAAATAGSGASQVVHGGSSAVASLAGPTDLSRAVPALPISALPVLTPAPLVLGDVVNQGPQTTPTPPRRSVSATSLLGVVPGTGSADLFAPMTPTRTGPDGHIRPLEPVPSPWRPSAPEIPPVAASASSAPGVHSGTLDTLPPAILVLAMLAAGGVALEIRRRPKFRYELRFSPPG
jgi:hypothetical protein